MDVVTILIILTFMLMTLGVFVYFKHRISAIDEELKKQSSFHKVKPVVKAAFHPYRP